MAQGSRYIVLQPITFSHNTGKTLPVIAHQEGVVSGEPFITIDISELQSDNDPYGCLVTSGYEGLSFPIYIKAPYNDSKYDDHPLIANCDFHTREGSDDLYINYVDYDLWVDANCFYREVPAKIYKLGTIIYDGLVFPDGSNIVTYDDDINTKYTFTTPSEPTLAIKATKNTKDVDETPIMILENIPGGPPLLGDMTLSSSEMFSELFPGGELPIASIISITQTIQGFKFVKKMVYEVIKYPD